MANCSKCGSEKIVPHVRIIDRAMSGAEANLTVVVYEKPSGLPLFKGEHRGELQANICGDCGHTDLTVTNPSELWDAYQKARNK